MAAGEIKDALDHPVPFILLVTIAVMCMAAILGWGAKAAGLPGPAAILHP